MWQRSEARLCINNYASHCKLFSILASIKISTQAQYVYRGQICYHRLSAPASFSGLWQVRLVRLRGIPNSQRDNLNSDRRRCSFLYTKINVHLLCQWYKTLLATHRYWNRKPLAKLKKLGIITMCWWDGNIAFWERVAYHGGIKTIPFIIQTSALKVIAYS